MIKALFDEDVDGAIINGLIRQRELDVVRAIDLGLAGRPDADVLEFAGRTDRLVISHDRRTMPAAASRRIADGLPMPGLIVVPRRLSRRAVIEELAIILVDSEPGDWVNVTAFLPFL